MNNNISDIIMENRNDLLREFLSSLNSLRTDELKQFINVTKEIKSARKPTPAKRRRKVIIVDDTEPVPLPRTKKPLQHPIPTPRKSIKQMVKDYENINKPVPKPRTKKQFNYQELK